MPLQSLFRSLLLGVVLLLIAILVWPGTARSQDAATPTIAPVMAEAIKQANVRSGPGLDFPQVATIVSGTKYPIIGRSARFPWYLIALTDTNGWVFADLVKVTGNVNSVPIKEIVITVSPNPAPATNPSTSAAPASIMPAASLTPTSPATTPIPSGPSVQSPTGVVAEAIDTANVRFGPGTDFPRIGSISKGQQYPVLRRHSNFPWVEIAFGDKPNGRGWVFKQTVTITGDLNKVPITSARDFGYPTLTPTAQMVVMSVPPWQGAATPGSPSDQLVQLGDTIYDYLLKQKYEPGTDRQGSVFLMDLKTGQAISLNPDIAYSGMSLIKIPILVTLYRKLSNIPNEAQADQIGEMMVCSDNLASNANLRLIGDGDVYAGVAKVTETMQKLGLTNTFMTAPFADDPKITPQPVGTVKTTADQVSTDPDLYNQSTPADLGWLLGSIYQCAIDGSGPLNTVFPGDFTVTECRQMIRALSTDKIGVLIEAGVSNDAVVAHKHGWISDTHGDSALVLTPGGDYVLTVMLHGKTWLDYDGSFPVVSEISRMVYNAYNPGKPVDKIHPQTVPASCTVDPALVKDLRSANLPPIR